MDLTLHNVIIRRTEYVGLKEKHRDLEEQYRALSTSYSMLGQDIKEVEAGNEGLTNRIKELEAQVELERGNALELVRRGLLLKDENEGLKRLLSQHGGSGSCSNDVVMGGQGSAP